MTPKRLKQVLLPAIGIGVLTVAIVMGVHITLDRSVSRTLKQTATVEARQWLQSAKTQLPDIERLIAGQTADGQQLVVVRQLVAKGDVFRFDLFDTEGRMGFSSSTPRQKKSSINRLALDAARRQGGGFGEAVLRHGPETSDLPATYVSVFLPLVGPSGASKGVFKIYVDRTAANELLGKSFDRVGFFLPVLCALIYFVPALAFLLRTRQVRLAQEHARLLTNHDPLTGLLNRAGFAARLETLFAVPRSQRRGIGIILLDIDDFKIFNEEGGDFYGDEYLKYVADAMRSTTRAGTDLIARVGGDEFVAAIPNITHAQLVEIGERVQCAMRQPFLHEGRTVTGHVSVGLHLSLGTEDPARALHAADVALYHAKGRGKDALVQFADGMERSLKERHKLERLLRAALESGGFEVHYQPIVAARDARIVGFEALLRLPDGDGGLISPSRFIPLAEEVGLIVQVGGWVLERAMHAAMAWPEDIRLSVNLSPRQFEGGTLVDQVREILDRTGFPAARLELEITETLLLDDRELVDRQIVGLKQLGLSIAMDDFGTGYSSLGYLMKYGFDKLKIDRSLVEAYDYGADRNGRIIETIVELGHNLGMTVTAEGIEDPRQAELLRALRCDLLQGYYFGRPMPERDATAIVAPHRASDIA